jgi:hypothetical protein
VNRTVFLTFAAVAYAIFGLGLLLVPGPFMAPFGVVLDADGEVTARVLGAALVGLALLFWWVRDAEGPAATAILKSQCIYNVIDIPVLAIVIATGTMGLLGLFPLALHVVLAAGFGLYGFGRSAAGA